MTKYTVKNSETGQRITFDWNGTEPPTDSDMEEVFSAAASFKQPEQKKEGTSFRTLLKQKGEPFEKIKQLEQPLQKLFEPFMKQSEVQEVKNAYLPRYSKTIETGKGNPAIGASLDVASLIQRAAAAGTGYLADLLGTASVKGTKEKIGKIAPSQVGYNNEIKLTPEQFKAAIAPMTKESFAKSMARTGGEGMTGAEGMLEDIARDPANLLSLVPGIGAAKIATLVPKIKKGLQVGQAIATPVVSISSHQGENIAKGDKVDLSSVGTEAALSALPLASKAANKLSIESMKNIINPSKRLKGQAAQDLIGKAMDYSSVPGGLKGMKDNILKKFEKLGSTNNKIISEADNSGEFVDIDKVFEEVANDLKNNKKFTPIKDQINSAIKKASLNVNSDFPSGMMLPSEALTYKRAVGQLGAWTKAVDEKGTLSTVMDPEATAREIVHNEIYKRVNEKLSKIAGPEFKKINQQFSELIPVEKALTDAIERKTNIFGLGDLIGGGATIAGGTQSLVSGLNTKDIQGDENLSGALPYLALWAGYKGVRSPRTMSALYKTSKIPSQIPGPVMYPLMQGTRDIVAAQQRRANKTEELETEAMKRRIQGGY